MAMEREMENQKAYEGPYYPQRELGGVKDDNVGKADGQAPYCMTGDGGNFDIYAPDAQVQTAKAVGHRSERAPFKMRKDVILVRSEEPAPGGYLDAIGSPLLPPKLRKRALLGMLTCDPLMNLEAVAVLEVVPIPEE